MTESNLQRIADFLSCYAEKEGCDPVPANPVYIRDAISLLISEGIFTAEELRREAVAEWNVIIPERFFLLEV